MRTVGTLVILAMLCSPIKSGAQALSESDTLRLTAPSMIFYEPKHAERESLMALSVFSFDSLSREFTMIRERMEPFLNKKGISAVLSTARFFIAEGTDPLILDRSGEKEVFGVILYSKKKEPLILRGLRSDSEVFTTMMRYFDIRR